MSDEYETRHDPEFYASMQEAALDAVGLDWVWYVDRVLERGIAELESKACQGAADENDPY